MALCSLLSADAKFCWAVRIVISESRPAWMRAYKPRTVRQGHPLLAGRFDLPVGGDQVLVRPGQEPFGLFFLVLQHDVTDGSCQLGLPRRGVRFARAEHHVGQETCRPVVEIVAPEVAQRVARFGAVEPGADTVDVVVGEEADVGPRIVLVGHDVELVVADLLASDAEFRPIRQCFIPGG